MPLLSRADVAVLSLDRREVAAVARAMQEEAALSLDRQKVAADRGVGLILVASTNSMVFGRGVCRGLPAGGGHRGVRAGRVGGGLRSSNVLKTARGLVTDRMRI